MMKCEMCNNKFKWYCNTCINFPPEEERLLECAISPDGNGILHKNAYIIWTIDKEGRIFDLQVFEFNRNYPEKCQKYSDYIKFRMDGVAYCDVGNCSTDWNEWSLCDILFKFGFQYGFHSKLVMKNSLYQLSKIAEWEKAIVNYLSFIGVDNPWE